MAKIANDVTELIGNTPLVKINKLFPDSQATVLAKLEFYNPASSVKDRIGPPLIAAGEESGKLQPGGTIVEPTSGNTGLGLAMAAILKGYRMVCTAADKIPKEKVALLEAFGVEVILCPTEVDADDPRDSERLHVELGHLEHDKGHRLFAVDRVTKEDEESVRAHRSSRVLALSQTISQTKLRQESARLSSGQTRRNTK